MSGKSFGTCGHELPYEWEHSGAARIAVKDYDREGRRMIAHKTVCRECRGRCVDAGDLLLTERSRINWLKGDRLNRNPVSKADCVRGGVRDEYK